MEAAQAVFEFAEILNEQKDKNSQIKELVEKTPTLLEALNSPFGQIVSSSLLNRIQLEINYSIKVKLMFSTKTRFFSY